MPSKATPPAIPEKDFFVTWAPGDDKGRALAVRTASQGLDRVNAVVQRANANEYFQIAPNNTSIRNSLSRRDYDEARDGRGRLPVRPKDVIVACQEAYKRVGVIRNVVDLMSDFACRGVDLCHPNERVEAWYREWFHSVRGANRSERFLNRLYRQGNVIVQRRMGKLESRPGVEGSPKEIPARYRFLNPVSLEVLEPELSIFAGVDQFQFAIKVPRDLASRMQKPKSELEKKLLSLLPPGLKNLQGDLWPLDPERVRAFYYKKDDEEIWASPMVEAVLPDVQLLQKMKLADLAALDGAVSCIRVWKLGSLEERIMPTEAAINRLAEMLCNNVQGGVMDLVWNPAIDLLETSTEVHKFLGNTKYEPVLSAIYGGVGIPPTLTGASTSGAFTNNAIGLQTLIERLEYGRDVLREFWEGEIRLVQEIMGWRFPATLRFDHTVLSDEAARLKLLVDLADRDLISAESLQDVFGLTSKVEEVRMRREGRRRKSKLLPRKAGPYHGDTEADLKKIFSQTGTVTPSQVGLELEEKSPGEKTLLQQQPKPAPAAPGGGSPSKPKGTPGSGRPKNAKDSTKRKKKRVLPRSAAAEFAGLCVWAESALSRIEELARPAYLKSVGKDNLRKLTAEEAEAFSEYQFRVLCHVVPHTPVDRDSLVAATRTDLSAPAAVVRLVNTSCRLHVGRGQSLTSEILRKYRAAAVAAWHCHVESEVNS